MDPVTSNEQAQLLQTVEMFEVIIQAQPDDYQALEVLKEAYTKLGREENALNISKRIAQAYVQMGQLSSAILEYEGILQKHPDEADVLAALGELEAKAAELSASAPKSSSSSTTSKATAAAAPANSPAQAPGNPAMPLDGITIMPGTQSLLAPRTSGTSSGSSLEGCRLLGNVLIREGVITKKDLDVMLNLLQTEESREKNDGISKPLIQVLAERNVKDLDSLLLLIHEKSRCPYLPLEIYDIIPDTVRLLPRDICFEFCIAPFDKISRTMMIATANPFDEGAKTAAQKFLDYNLQWYITTPQSLMKIIKGAFRSERFSLE